MPNLLAATAMTIKAGENLMNVPILKVNPKGKVIEHTTVSAVKIASNAISKAILFLIFGIKNLLLAEITAKKSPHSLLAAGCKNEAAKKFSSARQLPVLTALNASLFTLQKHKLILIQKSTLFIIFAV